MSKPRFAGPVHQALAWRCIPAAALPDLPITMLKESDVQLRQLWKESPWTDK